MYNGVGLDTARGSGTNGYVQRNLAHIKVSKDKTSYRSEDDIKRMEATLNRPPNEEILEHERRRKIEVKCFELQELMTDQGFPEDEIESKVNEYRQLLTKQMESSDGPTSEVIDDYGRKVASETHQIAELQQEKNARLRAAFAISDDYIDGSAMARNKSTMDNKTVRNGQEQVKQKEALIKQQTVAVVVKQESPKIVEKSIKESAETKKSDVEKRKSKHKHHSESSTSRRRKEELKRRKRKHRSPSSSAGDSASSSSSESSSSSSSSDSDDTSSSTSGSSSDSENSSSSSSSSESSVSEASPPKKKRMSKAKRSGDRSHKTEKSTRNGRHEEKPEKSAKNGRHDERTEKSAKNGRHERKHDRRSHSPARKNTSKK